MCGLAGTVISELPRNARELREIGELFGRLLVGSEHRGPHATGLALISATAESYVAKAPVPASAFVRSRDYRAVLERLDSDTTLLMGHTRWPTRGSHLDNANNHPLCSGGEHQSHGIGPSRGVILLTHNGTVTNHHTLSRLMGLKREAEVDSEVLLRMAEKNLTGSAIDPAGFVSDLSLCRGRLSVVAVATSDPTKILLVKGNQPLEVWRHEARGLIAYASELAILDDAIGLEAGWEEIRVKPWTLVAVETHPAMSLTSCPIPHRADRDGRQKP